MPAASRGYLDLYDFRLRVAALYADRNQGLRAGQNQGDVASRFRAGRDALFRDHPQSALDADQKDRFAGLRYFPYEPSACVEAVLDPEVAPETLRIEIGEEEAVPLTAAARVHFTLGEAAASLTVYWIAVYGGGLFLPFRDATAPEETYGGGRYLFDTIKGSDFLAVPERGGHRVVLDFNYAYNPSCAYNDRWVCPLAPPENRLAFPIPAGEMRFR